MDEPEGYGILVNGLGNRKADQLIRKDNWEILEEFDNWLYIYDRLPPRMKLMADLRIGGMSNKEIAKEMSISIRTVQEGLKEVKERFLRGENIG